ncbi:MAG: hypothetical protein K0R24_2304, partial [Gammaproteobacteria bacterium]|nr:hypothetical protein [Gammaproteobacteria bacterium]
KNGLTKIKFAETRSVHTAATLLEAYQYDKHGSNLKNVKIDPNNPPAPQEMIAKGFALSFGKDSQSMFGFASFKEACTIAFESISLKFKTEELANAALASIEVYNGKQNKTENQIRAVQTTFNDEYKIEIPATSIEPFLVGMLGADERFCSKIRDLSTLQRAEQAHTLTSIKAAKNPKDIQHDEVKQDTRLWIETAEGEPGVCSLNFGDSIPTEIIASVLGNYFETDAKRKFANEFQRWTPAKLNKDLFSSRAARKDTYHKGAYFPIEEGWQTENQAAILLLDALVRDKKITRDYDKEQYELTNKLLNECKAELLKRTVTTLALGGMMTEELSNALEERMIRLFASVDRKSIDEKTYEAVVANLRSNPTNKLATFINFITSNSVNGANEVPEGPLYHHNLINITLAAERQENRKGAAKISTAEFLQENGIDIKISGKTGGERKVSDADGAILTNLAKTFPLCYSFMTKESFDFKVKALDKSTIILSKSAGYVHKQDPEFFNRFTKELDTIVAFKKELGTAIQNFSKTHKNATLEDLAQDYGFLFILKKYEPLLLIDYSKDVDLFYKKNPSLAAEIRIGLEADAKRLGIDFRVANTGNISPRATNYSNLTSSSIAPSNFDTRARSAARPSSVYLAQSRGSVGASTPNVKPKFQEILGDNDKESPNIGRK